MLQLTSEVLQVYIYNTGLLLVMQAKPEEHEWDHWVISISSFSGYFFTKNQEV
ncbi:hypothetical protein [Bacillus sp. X1(2014)]|uniref:hypothetical protein n=1 Tax=Bacillus sp. X1(2014) TaxID=1565991 RepID=UPI001C92F5C4|nr:hypothetical protein [Bacillus sp. X1(2014)]